MKKRKTLLLILAMLLLICCSCAPQKQTADLWSYREPDGTWAEENRKAYLEVLYMYENLRPDAVPEASTDAQLLRLVDERYQELDKEAYMPRVDELQYEDMKPIALSLAEGFLLADKTPDLWFSHLRQPGLQSGTTWLTALIYEDGYHYRLSMDASDGSFQRWTRYPPGYWTTSQYGALTEAASEPSKERTDEELINAVKPYAEMALASGTSEIIDISAVIRTTSPYVQKDVVVGLAPYEVYYISVDYDDLSITSVERK